MMHEIYMRHPAIISFLCLLLFLVVLPTGAYLLTRTRPDDETDDTDGRDSDRRNKPFATNILLYQARWACTECAQEFRMPDSVLSPILCPACGARNRVAETVLGDTKVTTSVCPACGRLTEMLGNEEPAHRSLIHI